MSRTHRVILINGEKKPKKKRRNPVAAKKRRSGKKRRAPKKNPATNPAPKRRRPRRRRSNPRRRRVGHRRHNPTGVGRGIVMGMIGGVASEAMDYGVDQISSFSPTAQTATSLGLHGAAAVGAAFIDPCLLASLTGCTVKTASQRIRAQIALAPAKKAATPAATDTTKKDTAPAPAMAGLGAFTTTRSRGGLGMNIAGNVMPSTVRGGRSSAI